MSGPEDADAVEPIDAEEPPDVEPPPEETFEDYVREPRPAPEPEPEPEPLRLAKLMAQRGVASRRKAEELIRAGEVTVNGVVVTTLGTLVRPTDRIKVEGQAIRPEERKAWYLMYKPRGVLVGEDPDGRRPSIRRALEDLNLHVDPVGRLDFNTEGAVLLTNDRDLAHKLVHPRAAVPKRYIVKVYRTPDASDLKRIERGVQFPDGTRSRPARARLLDKTDKENAWLEVTITESGQKVVQKILTEIRHPPSKVRRESFATISIRGMQRGQIRELTPPEIARLRDIAEGVEPARAGRQWRGEGYAKPKPKAKRGRSKSRTGARKKRSG